MRICEDALSVSGSSTRGLLIERCSFFDAEDKAIQLNAGRDITIRDCVFRQTSTAIKLDRGPTGVRIHSNLFLDSDVAIHLSGDDTRASSIRGNSFEDVGVFLKVGNGAIAQMGGGNYGSSLGQAIQLRDGGRLVWKE
jgi:nitrous oxidase accessory protein NosD